MTAGTGGSVEEPGQEPVFLSYASQDVAVADALCAALEVEGIRCWIAPRDVRPGEFYADAIVHGINASRGLVLLLSAHSAASPHVLREVERASAKAKPVLAFRLDAAPLPPGLEYFLSASQWIDAREGQRPRATAALIAALKSRAGGAPAFAGSPAPAGSPAGLVSVPATSRRTGAVIAVGAAIVALALGAVLFVTRGGTGRRPPATSPAAPDTLAPGSSAVSSTPSVAVLPFSDLSQNRDQAYFSDGLSEELIDLLGKVPGLRVPASTSSFYFKGRQATLADIAQALHVTHVVEGSVRKSGNQLRITAELVRVVDDTRIWSESFDRTLDDIFKIQDDIAGAVVKALKVSLLDGRALSATPAHNGTAYTLYLQGKSTMKSGTPESYGQAVGYFERAVAMDPGFAQGWAALGDLRADGYGSFRAPPYSEVTLSAHADAERALALDSNLPEAHVALGRIAYLVDLDWDTAKREFGRAIELAPNQTVALRFSSYLASTVGDAVDARRFAELATASDPLDYWNYFAAGGAGYSSGQLAFAEDQMRRALALNDRAGAVHSQLANVLLARGRPDAALEEYGRETFEAWRLSGSPRALDALGRHEEANRVFAEAESRYGDTFAAQIALSYAARNDRVSACRWLERSWRQHDATPVFLRHDPLLKNLEGEPCFEDFLRKMKLPL